MLTQCVTIGYITMLSKLIANNSVYVQ